MSKSIPALLQKFRDGKALTPQEQEWVMGELERMAATPVTTSITDPDAERITDMHDVVAFTMPMTVMRGTYELGRLAYQGAVEAEHHVYLALARMHQQDVLGYRELFESRGDVEGLKPFINWTAPAIPCRLVRRAERNEVGECKACVALKEANKRVAA